MAIAIARLLVIVILPVPKVIERVFALLELNVAVVNVKSAKANVPVVNVVVPLTVNAAANDVVPALLIVKLPRVLLLDVIVPVPIVLTVKLVNVPPDDNITLLTFTVALGVNALEPKSSVLKYPEDIVGANVPVVYVRFNTLLDVQPVDPVLIVFAINAASIRPPVPVQVKLVASVIVIGVVESG